MPLLQWVPVALAATRSNFPSEPLSGTIMMDPSVGGLALPVTSTWRSEATFSPAGASIALPTRTIFPALVPTGAPRAACERVAGALVRVTAAACAHLAAPLPAADGDMSTHLAAIAALVALLFALPARGAAACVLSPRVAQRVAGARALVVDAIGAVVATLRRCDDAVRASAAVGGAAANASASASTVVRCIVAEEDDRSSGGLAALERRSDAAALLTCGALRLAHLAVEADEESREALLSELLKRTARRLVGGEVTACAPLGAAFATATMRCIATLAKGLAAHPRAEWVANLAVVAVASPGAASRRVARARAAALAALSELLPKVAPADVVAALGAAAAQIEDVLHVVKVRLSSFVGSILLFADTYFRLPSSILLSAHIFLLFDTD